MEKVELTIQISFELYQEMCKICRRLNISIDEFIEIALENEIEKNRDEITRYKKCCIN